MCRIQQLSLLAWLEYYLANPNPFFFKIHSPQYFILRPLSCPYVFIGARGIQENYQNWKKVAAEHIYMHFSKIVLKKGFGFVKVLARSGTWGARHNISDPEKKSINSAGAFFRHMRAPKKNSRRRSRKNSKKNFKNFQKKSGRAIFQKPFFNAFFAFSEDFIFFVPQIFFWKSRLFLLMIHFSTMSYVFWKKFASGERGSGLLRVRVC